MATVTVNGPFQVCHDGEVYLPGETAEVPDAVAKQWLGHGWVEVAEAPKKPRRSPRATTAKKAP